jgi:hypothetical protein
MSFINMYSTKHYLEGEIKNYMEGHIPHTYWDNHGFKLYNSENLG